MKQDDINENELSDDEKSRNPVFPDLELSGDDSFSDTEKTSQSEIRFIENSENDITETEAAEAEKNKKPPFDIKRELFDWSESLVTALLIIVILFAFFVRSIGVDGTSMIETLHHGDYLIVSNMFYTPKQGDIVVLTKKTFMTDSIVKRIIATGGQTVDMDFTTGEVWVDGELLDEPYLREVMWKHDDVTFPVRVPDSCIFVMGDNRNGSTDSRNSMLGMVDERYIVGRVLLRIWPLSSIGTIK